MKRDGTQDRLDDILMAHNTIIEPLSLIDTGSRMTENEQGSDPAHDPARRIQEEADSQAEEAKTQEAPKQAETEKKQNESINKESPKEVPISRVVPESACPKNIPRGLRNNNPGNLRGWQKGQKKDAGSQFVVFDTMENGLSAMAGNILNYDRAGANTVGSIIKKWAPKNENDTESYVRVVSKQLGVHPEQKLNVKDASTTAALISAIVQHENGCNPFKQEALLEAVYDRFNKWNVPYKRGDHF